MNPKQPQNIHQQKSNGSEIVSEPQEPRSSRLKRILIIIGLSLVGLIILAVLAIFISSSLRKHEIDKQVKAAPQKIASSRSNAEKTADRKLEQVENNIKRAEVTDQQIASSKVDVCYVDNTDQGLFPASYYQDCYLRYVQGYTTKLSKDELKQKLMAQTETQAFFNKENQDLSSADDDGCALYSLASADTADAGELFFRPANVVSDEYGCEVPNSLQSSYIINSVSPDDELATKVYRTYDTTKVDNATNQFWFSFDEYYYHEELGCNTELIFCGNPRPIPIHAP